MKTGRSLTELAHELERQMKVRKDYLAGTTSIEMTDGAELKGLNGHYMGLTDYAHIQMANRLDIPRAYYMKMLGPQGDCALLARNVNTWLHRKPETRLVRTLDGTVRAILSDKYRPLDNYDLATAMLPTLSQQNTQIVSAELTEQRMYIKAIAPWINSEVQGSQQKGDIVQAGIVISNSEIGAGSLRVEPFVYRLVCLNGMIAPDSSFKKYHIGRGFEAGEAVRELLSNETRKLDDKVFWLKVQDVVRGAFDRDLFNALVARMSEATVNKITSDDIPGVVEITAKTYGFQEDTKSSILRHLIHGGDLSQWGLVNAVTETANTAPDYELATSLERAGGKILDLSPSEWQRLAA